MVSFQYVAKNPETGEIIKAEVQAENEQAAAKLLIRQKLYPIEIVDKEKASRVSSLTNHISTKDRVIFTRQLSTLINAGLPLVQSLRTVKDQLSNKSLQSILDQIISSVEGGSTLAAAFEQHPKVFNNIYVSLVAAGETSGSLDKSLERIANQQEKDAAINSKIRGALIYPAIVLFVIVAVLVFMLVTVLPQIVNLYQTLQKPVPSLTAILAAISSDIIKFWWLALLVLAAAVFFALRGLRSSKGTRATDTFKLKLPVFGRIFEKVYMARFARTLSTMLSSGIPMLQGLEIVQQAIGNQLIAETVEEAAQKVKGGKALSGALEDKQYILPLVPQMIRIGEQSGALDQMLDKVAAYYEDEVDEEVKNLSVTIEPVLMVVLGCLVAFILAAILLPIYSLVGSGV